MELEDEPDEEAQEEVEQEYQRRDEKTAKTARLTKDALLAHIEDEKVDKEVEEFLTSATENQREVFSVFRTGKENPAQIKRVIEVARQKGTVLDEKLGVAKQEVDAAAEEKATEIAAKQYGAGPLPPGQNPTPQDEEKAMIEEIGKGNQDALVAALFRPPGA